MTQQVSLGLIAAPELPEKLAKDLVEMLPEALSEYISKDADWTVDMVVDSLTGGAESVHEIFEEAMSYMETNEWDYVVSLTDLPVFQGKHIVAADVDETAGVGLLSIPAFGWMPVLKRVQKGVIQVVQEYLKAAESAEIEEAGSAEKKEEVLSNRLLRRQFPIAPVRKIRTWVEGTQNFHIRYVVIPRINGDLRLLSGMTFANNPLKLMSSLTTVITIAFTTGAFGMIFTTVWQLSYLFSNWRLTGVTFAAILGMTIWVILAHELWEPSTSRNSSRIRRLYNLTTVITLLVAVIVYYVILFLLFFGTSLVFIPPDFLTETLPLPKDSPAGLLEYMQIAWFASSISTVAGAIGAGLENDELVRDATYGYRQKRRYQAMQQNTN